MIDWLQSPGNDISEELDFGDVYFRIATHFGIRDSMAEFAAFICGGESGPGHSEQLTRPSLTLGTLADWIA